MINTYTILRTDLLIPFIVDGENRADKDNVVSHKDIVDYLKETAQKASANINDQWITTNIQRMIELGYVTPTVDQNSNTEKSKGKSKRNK